MQCRFPQALSASGTIGVSFNLAGILKLTLYFTGGIELATDGVASSKDMLAAFGACREKELELTGEREREERVTPTRPARRLTARKPPPLQAKSFYGEP